MIKPLLSVVIPVYNVDRYIEECLDSILLQDYTDFEVVLIDDGSKDRTAEICDMYVERDNRVSVLHKENEGVSKARSLGARIAKGEYLFFVDGDDLIKEGCFKYISEVINKYKADIIYYGQLVDTGKEYVKADLTCREGIYLKKDIESEIFPYLIHNEEARYFPPGLAGKVIKRELFLENQLVDPKVTIGEDGACIIPCIFYANSMYVVPEYFYVYRYNASSATKSRKVFNWEWPKIVAVHLAQRINIETLDFKQQISRKVLHDVFNVAVTQFYKKETYKKVVKEIEYRLEDDYYKKCIMEASFSNSIKSIMMSYAMKKRCYILLFLYSKLK